MPCLEICPEKVQQLPHPSQQRMYKRQEDRPPLYETSPTKRRKNYSKCCDCDSIEINTRCCTTVNIINLTDISCVQTQNSGGHERNCNFNVYRRRTSENLDSDPLFDNNEEKSVRETEVELLSLENGIVLSSFESIDKLKELRLNSTNFVSTNCNTSEKNDALKRTDNKEALKDLVLDLSETGDESLVEDTELFCSPKDNDGNTELHQRILEEDEAGALRIIKKAAEFDDLNVPNYLGQTAIHLAVISGQAKIVRKLMSAGALVSFTDDRGNTPLHLACQNGHTDSVRHLLTPIEYDETIENRYKIPPQAIPQDLEIKNQDGHNCLELADINGHLNEVVNTIYDLE